MVGCSCNRSRPMNFLNKLWPWKEISRLNGEIDFLKRTLEHEQSSHNITRASLQDHKLELIDHRSRVTQGQKDLRKLATILAMKGGITILLLFLSLSALGQPIQRQLFTTNTLPILSSISGPMVTTNGSGKPELTFNGAGLTNITGVAVAQGTNIITRTNGQVVTVNGVTDTNVINILLAGATNQSTVVSNGITARIIKSLGISIDGGGAVLVAGVKGYVEVPVACTIISATILADQSGSIAIETWRTNSSSMPPTRAGVLFTNYLTTAQASTDATLANATSLTLATQDRLGWNIITNALSVTRITLQLRVQP